MSQRNETTAPVQKHRTAHKRKRHKCSGIFSRNPVFVGGLLIAPVVMASTTLKNAVALIITFAIVTIPTMILASLIGKKLPFWLRIPMDAISASIMLIPAYYAVRPISPAIFDSMGMYFALMAVNSVLFLRCEKVAICKEPGDALIDGAAYTAGFAVAALLVSATRELLAANTLWDIPVHMPFRVSAAALPFAGFLLVALFAAAARYLQEISLRLREKHRANKALAQRVAQEVGR